MTTASEKILDRIRKLLAMADDASSPNEAAIAASRAAKLMAEYNLSHADVILKSINNDSIIERDAEGATFQAPPDWWARMIIPVAHLHDCECRYAPGVGGYRAQFLGHVDDVEAAAYVFEYLTRTLIRLAGDYSKTIVYDRERLADFRIGCSIAITNTIYAALEEKKAATAQHTAGTSLVVAKQALIQTKYKLNYSKEKKAQRSQSKGLIDGYAAGSQVQLTEARADLEGAA